MTIMILKTLKIVLLHVLVIVNNRITIDSKYEFHMIYLLFSIKVMLRHLRAYKNYFLTK